MSRLCTTGFTLIELLVVITIIVVLLALLTPALDKAIYTAELAVCASHKGTIAKGALTYAASNKRSYPHRPGVKDDSIWPSPCIYNGSPGLNAFYNAGFGGSDMTVYDDRPLLRTFISLNTALNDPLTPAVDYETAHEDSTLYSTGNLWFGYQFKGFSGMKKLGNRLGWSDGTPDARRWRFNVLASDRDTQSGGSVQASHPDADGNLTNTVVQDDFYAAPGLKFVLSMWETGIGRGLIDLNYGMQDGSTSQFKEISLLDPEMAHVPEITQGPNGWWVTLPQQQ